MSYTPTPSLFCNSAPDQTYTLKGSGTFPATFTKVLLAFCVEYITTPPNFGPTLSFGVDGTGTNDTGNGGIYVLNPFNSSYNSGIAVYSKTAGATNFTSAPSISGVGAGLNQWVISVDVTNNIMQTYYNGVAQTFGAGTVFNTTSPIAINSQINLDILGNTSNALADIYCAFPAAFFDLSVPANVAKFWSSGAPADLGDTGTGPTGTAPAVYLTTRPGGPRSSILNNLGSAGGVLTFNHSGLVPFVSDGCAAPIYPANAVQTQLIGTGGL